MIIHDCQTRRATWTAPPALSSTAPPPPLVPAWLAAPEVASDEIFISRFRPRIHSVIPPPNPALAARARSNGAIKPSPALSLSSRRTRRARVEPSLARLDESNSVVTSVRKNATNDCGGLQSVQRTLDATSRVTLKTRSLLNHSSSSLSPFVSSQTHAALLSSSREITSS